MLKNSSTSGATLEQTSNADSLTVNNITGYDAMLNSIVMSADDFANIEASFVDGQLQITMGNVTDNFIADQNLASLDEVINSSLDEIITKPVADVDCALDDGSSSFQSTTSHIGAAPCSRTSRNKNR